MFEGEIPLGKAKNLAGQHFGRLVALYRVANQGNRVVWHCVCDCGNEKNVRAADLVRGLTQSCGCLARETAAKICRKKTVDLTNMRFGRLVALYPTEERSRGNHVIWYCSCDCGNTTLVSTDHLRDGSTQSCGCSVSHGEQKISELLNKHEIPYEPQKKFTSCCFSDTNAQAKFDFYISEDNYLIEYDGEQHFEAIEHFGGESQFQIQQKHDAYKNQWCLENNIPLIRIPYTRFKDLCIEDLKLETTQFRVV